MTGSAAESGISAERPPWLVRVRLSKDKAPVGAGVLISKSHVLTCAHVLSASLGSEPPDSACFIEFQHLPSAEPIAARVVESGWYPESRSHTQDIAILAMEAPPPDGAEPAPMRSSEIGIWDHGFRAYGYPRGHADEGVPATGTIVGAAGREWLQLRADPHGYGLEPGFSGSPIWDLELNAVIGIVVARDRPRKDEDDLRTGYGIPAEVVSRYWPSLTLINNTTGRSIVVRQDAPRAVQEAAAALDDPYWKTRRNAVRTLAETSHPSSMEVLHAALTHTLLPVRAEVAETLAHRDDPAAIPILINVLIEEAHATDALDSLIHLDGKATAPLMATIVNEMEPFVRRHLCAVALVRTGKVEQVMDRWAKGSIESAEMSRFRSGSSRGLNHYHKYRMRDDVAEAIKALDSSELGLASLNGFSLEDEWWTVSYLPRLVSIATGRGARIVPAPVLVIHPDGPDLMMTPLVARTAEPDAAAIRRAVEAQARASAEPDDTDSPAEANDTDQFAAMYLHRTYLKVVMSAEANALRIAALSAALTSVALGMLLAWDARNPSSAALVGMASFAVTVTLLLDRWLALSVATANEYRARTVRVEQSWNEPAHVDDRLWAARWRTERWILRVTALAWLAAAVYAVLR